MGSRIPTANDHAKWLLGSHGITVEEIIAVRPDSVLYLGNSRRAMTAWLHSQADGKVEIRYEPGFPAEPHPDLVARHSFYPSRESAIEDMDQA